MSVSDSHEAEHENSFPCKFCNESFKNPKLLETHRKSVHEVKKSYTCKYCLKVFHYSNNLKQHERIHTGLTPFQCSECPMSFKQKILLDIHFSKKHLDKKGLYPCQLCREEFSYAKGLRRHMATLHRDAYLDNGTNPTKLLCNLCWKSFDSKNQLEEHEASIHEKHKCKLCRKNFKSLSHLKEHLLLHLDVRPHKCELCPDNSIGFLRESQLKTHINQCHPS